MPGFILEAHCTCGFCGWVHPGSPTFNELNVIAYHPEKPDLITIDAKEAEKRGLRTIPDPYLALSRRPMADPEVRQLGEQAMFECPTCREKHMTFTHRGFWD